jgi:hypothetical protein
MKNSMLKHTKRMNHPSHGTDGARYTAVLMTMDNFLALAAAPVPGAGRAPGSERNGQQGTIHVTPPLGRSTISKGARARLKRPTNAQRSGAEGSLKRRID